MFPVATGDFLSFLQPWVEFIKANGYMSALQYDFYNYTPAYAYILIAIAKAGINPLFGIKAVSVAFEFFGAYFAGKILHLKYKNLPIVLIAMAVFPWIPSVMLNSSYLSQCDSIYSSFAIGSIYFLLKNKNGLSVLFLGLAFVFKLQTAFLLPVFFVAILQSKIPWYYFFMIPAVYILSVLPAYASGRPLGELLSIYLMQSNYDHELTLNFPNLYIWIDNIYYNPVKLIGIIFTVVLTLCSGILLRKYRFSYEMWIRFSLLSSVLIPFILPGMHERYLYLGDIMSLLYFMVFRKQFFVPGTILSFSLYSYARCSRYNYLLPMWPVFFLYLFFIVFLCIDFLSKLRNEPVALERKEV